MATNIINDNFPNVPGFVSQISDYGLAIPPVSTSPTQSVLILGVATDGPQNTPVPIPSLGFAVALYGGFTTVANTASGGNYANKSVLRGLYETFQSGCADVRICRVGGTFATVTLNDSTSAHTVLVSSGYPGAKYNALSFQYASVTGVVTIITTDGISHSIAPPFPPGTITYGQLCAYISNSGYNINAYMINGNPGDLVTIASVGPKLFSGGTDGTNPTDAVYSQALNAAYAALTDYAVDFVVPMGAYLQPSNLIGSGGLPNVPNVNSGDTVYFGQNLAQFVATMSTNFHSALGVIAMQPLTYPTFTGVNQRVAQLATTSYNFQYQTGYADPITGPSPIQLGNDGNPVNIGRFLNITVGPDFIQNNGLFGNYIGDNAASYAGQIVSLPPQNSPTNKIVTSVLGLAYSYGLGQLNTLNGQAFTCFNIYNNTVRCNADNTYAPNGTVNPPSAPASDYQKLSTIRITYAAVEAVRAALQGYIGNSTSVAIANAMATDVNTALKSLVKSGALQDFSYNINSSSTNQILGQVIVQMYLTPALEMRKIFLQTQLVAPAAISISSSSNNQGSQSII